MCVCQIQLVYLIQWPWTWEPAETLSHCHQTIEAFNRGAQQVDAKNTTPLPFHIETAFAEFEVRRIHICRLSQYKHEVNQLWKTRITVRSKHYLLYEHERSPIYMPGTQNSKSYNPAHCSVD